MLSSGLQATKLFKLFRDLDPAHAHPPSERIDERNQVGLIGGRQRVEIADDLICFGIDIRVGTSCRLTSEAHVRIRRHDAGRARRGTGSSVRTYMCRSFAATINVPADQAGIHAYREWRHCARPARTSGIRPI